MRPASGLAATLALRGVQHLRGDVDPGDACPGAGGQLQGDAARAGGDVEHARRPDGNGVHHGLAPAAVLAERQHLGQAVVPRRKAVEELAGEAVRARFLHIVSFGARIGLGAMEGRAYGSAGTNRSGARATLGSRRKAGLTLRLLDPFWLLLAGFGGGLSGSVAGLASLVSYPALLAAGLSPVSANVTNTVSLVFSSAGSVWGRPRARQGTGPDGASAWSRFAMAGGAAGGLLSWPPPRPPSPAWCPG